MRTSTYIRIQTSLYLERDEEFVEYNEKGHPFYVRQMQYSGGTHITLSGPSKNAKVDADGSDRGSVTRSTVVHRTDLDDRYLLPILDSRRAQIATITPVSE